MKIRINNDIVLKWTILRCKEPEDFTNAMHIDLKIVLLYTNVKYTPQYIIDGNVITMQFPAKKQVKAGKYALYIQYKKPDDTIEGGIATYTIDYSEAFILVDKSDKVSEMSCNNTINLESVVDRDSDGRDGITPKIGENGNWFLGSLDTGKPSKGKDFVYSDFTEEQIENLQKPAIEAGNFASAAANESIRLNNAISNEEVIRKESENTRIYNEQQRILMENLRKSSEQNRIDDEMLRIDGELLRSDAETSRVTAETGRVNVEASRVTAETSRVNAETSRVTAETGRVNAETKRASDFTSFLTTSSEQIKAETDKIAPAIDSAVVIAENAATNATTQANYAKAQGDYAKEQGASIVDVLAGKANLIDGYIDEKQVNSLVGAATSLVTNKAARSNCNLFDIKSGMTYVVTFVASNVTNSALLLDFGSSDNSESTYALVKQSNIRNASIFPPIYMNQEYVSVDGVLRNSINQFVIKFNNNNIEVILNNNQRNSREFSYTIFKEGTTYGLSPITVNKLTGEITYYDNIISMRSFNYLLNDTEVTNLWNYGRPDKYVIPDVLKATSIDAPLIGAFEDFSLRTNTNYVYVTQEEGYIASLRYVSTQPQFIHTFKVRKLKNIGVKYKARLVVSTSVPLKVNGITSLAGNFSVLTYNVQDGITGNVGDNLILDYEFELVNPDGYMCYFTAVTPEDLIEAVVKVKEISITKQYTLTEEFLSSGFRKDKLIDSSLQGKDITITTGNVKLSYNELYKDTIYKEVNPNLIPQFVGQKWFNTITKAWYISNGSASIADWTTLIGAAVAAYRITTDDNGMVQNVEALFGNEPNTMLLDKNVYVVQNVPIGDLIGYNFDGTYWVEPETEEIPYNHGKL